MDVEIADDPMISASRLHRGCILKMFYERYPFDLVPISLQETKIIMDMDSFSRNGVMIYYEHQLVRVRTRSGGELVIRGEGAQHEPTIFSVARARRYL